MSRLEVRFRMKGSWKGKGVTYSLLEFLKMSRLEVRFRMKGS